MVFKHLKQEKKLVIPPMEEPKDEDQLTLINNRTNYKVNKDKIEKLFKHNIKDIKLMMERISAKAQLNTLLQQLPGRVTSPKLQKKPVEGNWSVPVRIEYRTEDQIENKIPPKVYEKTVICHNARIAEEQAYMLAIVQMYQENPELFEKIQSIKLAKNIKDSEKKLPLVRDLKQEGWTAVPLRPYRKLVMV